MTSRPWCRSRSNPKWIWSSRWSIRPLSSASSTRLRLVTRHHRYTKRSTLTSKACTPFKARPIATPRRSTIRQVALKNCSNSIRPPLDRTWSHPLNSFTWTKTFSLSYGIHLHLVCIIYIWVAESLFSNEYASFCQDACWPKQNPRHTSDPIQFVSVSWQRHLPHWLLFFRLLHYYFRM